MSPFLRLVTLIVPVFTCLAMISGIGCDGQSTPTPTSTSFAPTATFTVAASDSRYYEFADFLCDGTDDNVEIQEALDAAHEAGGGTVQLLEGSFWCGASSVDQREAEYGAIVVKENVRMIGQGRGTVLTMESRMNSDFVTMLSNTEIRDLYIDHNGTNQTWGRALLVVGSNVIISHCYVTNGCYDNIQIQNIEGKVSNVIVDGCYSWNAGQGPDVGCGIEVRNECDMITLVNNHIWDCNQAGIVLSCHFEQGDTSAHDITIANNTISDSEYGFDTDIVGTPTDRFRNITFCNNIIEGSNADGIELNNVNNSVLGNNIIRNSGMNGIRMLDSCNDISVVGGTVEDNTHQGIYGHMWLVDGVLVRNNGYDGIHAEGGAPVIRGCAILDHNQPQMRAVYVAVPSVIDGNRIESANDYGIILFDGSGGSTVEGNHIANTRNHGICVRTDRNLVAANYLEGVTIELSRGVSYNHVVDNRFTLTGVNDISSMETNYMRGNLSGSGQKAGVDHDKILVWMRNISGYTLESGDVVVFRAVPYKEGPATGYDFSLTTEAGDKMVLGMVAETIEHDSWGYVVQEGKVSSLKVDGTIDIAVGDFLSTIHTVTPPSMTEGIAKKATSGEMAFAMALESYTADDRNGVIEALLFNPRYVP